MGHSYSKWNMRKQEIKITYQHHAQNTIQIPHASAPEYDENTDRKRRRDGDLWPKLGDEYGARARYRSWFGGRLLASEEVLVQGGNGIKVRGVSELGDEKSGRERYQKQSKLDIFSTLHLQLQHVVLTYDFEYLCRRKENDGIHRLLFV